MERSRIVWITVAGLVLAVFAAPLALRARAEPTIEELKGRLASADLRDRPPLCIRISERQLEEADKFYAAGDSAKGKAALADVVEFAEQARDYAIQTHKHEKQAEIALRKAARKLADLKHTIPHDDQAEVQHTIDRLEQIRDDLLLAMFPKGGKK